MIRYTLNATVGGYSAGTEVRILAEQTIDFNAETVTVFIGNESLDVPVKALTKRRNRTQFINTPLRPERRREAQLLNDLIVGKDVG